MRRTKELNIDTLQEKLRTARTRRCNMIFDGLSPDVHDQIHLANIEQCFRYMHPESAKCLQDFFQTFYAQTKKNVMSRKYFTVNMLSALERKKFNLQSLFQDPEIAELEARLHNVLGSSLRSDETLEKTGANNETHIKFDELITDHNDYKGDFPLQKVRKTSPNPSFEKENIPEPSMNQNLRVKAVRSDGVYEHQRENNKKLRNYLQGHLKADLLEPVEQQENINRTVIEKILSERQLLNPSAVATQGTEHFTKRSPFKKSKNALSSEEIELSQCTFEPQLHKPLKGVLTRDVKPKIYDFLLKNKFLKGLKSPESEENEKSFHKRCRINIAAYKVSDIIKTTNHDSSNSQSRSRPPRKSSFELMHDLSFLNQGYADLHNRKVGYAKDRLIPEYLELKTRRGTPERQGVRQKSQESVQRSKSSARAPVQMRASVTGADTTSTFRNRGSVNIYSVIRQDPSRSPEPEAPSVPQLTDNLEIRRQYHEWKRQSEAKKLPKKRPSLASTKISSTPQSAFAEDNRLDNSVCKGHYISGYHLHSSSKKKREERHGRSGSQSKEREKSPMKKNSSAKKQSSIASFDERSDIINNRSLQQHNQNVVGRISVSSKYEMLLNKHQAYHIRPNNGMKKVTDKERKTNKENNYNFSFTEREISQTQY